MTELLQKALAEISKLPDEQQDAIADLVGWVEVTKPKRFIEVVYFLTK